ncbi:MAG: hypothetical protein M3Q99_05055 [Acidobacteriota bacterium]|nr:hypothetical protein [Acidobacteriota bacterium]
MKFRIPFRRIIFGATILNFLFLGFLVADSNAQTPRRSKTRKANPVVQTIPAGTGSEPLIISRADDFPGENRVIVQPQAETQTEKPVEKPVAAADGINDLNERVKNLETNQKKDTDEKERRLLLNLDILTRAEQRSETLRKQLFEMIEKESQIKTKLDQIENDIRPEMIERSVATVGTLRPEELRDQRRKTLTSDKRNLQNLLTDVQNTRSSLELNLQKADIMVEKLRYKLEKQIDDAIGDEPNQ